MSFPARTAALILMCAGMSPQPASAGGAGGPGCTNLPLYNRALGALQGMTSACDMSVEEARRIIADHDRGAQRAPPPQQRPNRERAPYP